MFKATGKVEIDTRAILARHRAEKFEAQKWLDRRIVLDCDPFVPMDTGMLASSPRRGTDFGSGKIFYNTPYAAKLYYGENLNFSRDKHPAATHHWFEEAKALWLGHWGNMVAGILKGKWRAGA